MRFNPNTNALFTDNGTLLKILRCPLRKRWEHLHKSTDSPHRLCDDCSCAVLDTAFMSDDEVMAAVHADPFTCLCVSSRQENIRIDPFISAEPNDAADSR
jgi:hypothetical protein